MSDRTSLVGVAQMLAILACGPAPTEVSRPDVALPISSSAPPVSVVSAPVPKADPIALPEPSPRGPEGSDQVAVAFAQLVCAAALKKSASGYAVGCRDCGNMAGDDTLAVVEDGEPFFHVLGTFPGSFTSPGTKP